MTSKNKTACRNCKNFQQFYSKGICNFIKERSGYCCKNRAVVKNDDTCDNYVTHKKPNDIVTTDFIDRVIKDVEELGWIFRNC